MTNYDIENKIINPAIYMIENQSTIRATAKYFNIPKSSLHNNLTKKLQLISNPLYTEIKSLLEENFKIKHIHGGMSTKLKYEKLKLQINKNDEFEEISIN